MCSCRECSCIVLDHALLLPVYAQFLLSNIFSYKIHFIKFRDCIKLVKHYMRGRDSVCIIDQEITACNTGRIVSVWSTSPCWPPSWFSRHLSIEVAFMMAIFYLVELLTFEKSVSGCCRIMKNISGIWKIKLKRKIIVGKKYENCFSHWPIIFSKNWRSHTNTGTYQNIACISLQWLFRWLFKKEPSKFALYELGKRCWSFQWNPLDGGPAINWTCVPHVY